MDSVKIKRFKEGVSTKSGILFQNETSYKITRSENLILGLENFMRIDPKIDE